MLCENIDHDDVKVPEAMAKELAAIAAMMKMRLPPWIADPSCVSPIRDN
jgi:hypothetical protein